ncbi:amidohydrolase [Tepidanaerobacter syntrophicus]|uniref:amidohydrolase family protein n=1 Tax=Tepidanaerobacter syntrophicus TaxID=224999 RepID=UPI0022EDD069|nr:amidohydrolase family protein [Tepidanaerobacter syntrophicus]GLI18278.1 amidohydrolase [Tepidanaerobacter syntrophicus]
MNIIDAHAHIIERIAGFGSKGELRPLGNGKARWANGDEIFLIPSQLGSYDFTAESFISLMNEEGVNKAVLLQGSFYGFQNEYSYDATKKYPEKFVSAGTLDPFCKQKNELLQRLLDIMKIRIIKFEVSSGGGLMSYHKDFDLDGEVFNDIFSTIANYGCTLVLDIGSPGMPSFQIEAVRKVAMTYPEMKIVICHLLAPTLNDAHELEEGLRKLCLENVWFDLAAIPWNLAPETYPYPTGRKYLKMAKNIVGSKKMIWGSDVPSVITREKYSNLISFITTANIFTDKELEEIFYLNAVDVYFA